MMRLKQIMVLRDLDYEQLVNLATQRGVVSAKEVHNSWRYSEGLAWTPDRIRLRLIDDICDEELREQRMDEAIPDEMVDAAVALTRPQACIHRYSVYWERQRKALQAVLPMALERLDTPEDES